MFDFLKRGREREEPAAADMEEKQALAGFEYFDAEAREQTAGALFTKAKTARTAKEVEWVRYNDYYNFLHDASGEMREAVRDSGIGWDPAVVPDPFIMVESQVDPVVPEAEFRGRDDDLDSVRAKQREYAVKYVCQNNRLQDLNTANERRLKKLGDAFWKVYWDEDMMCGAQRGDIRVRDVPVEALYVDPSAGADGLQAGQYVDYVYSMHRVVFLQKYGAELSRRGLSMEEIMGGYYREAGGIFDLVSPAERDDTVQVLEHWFRHPVDGDGMSAGEIGCSIQAGGREVKYIPAYWERTGAQNKQFPFVHYWCIRDENEFYNKSELASILPLVDAADRELANALLNDAFTANDIVLMEDGALADGEEFTNVPGAVVKVRPNKAGAVARLGGLNDGRNSLPMLEWVLGQIQRTNRNYETNQGKASSSIQTATELSMLRSDADGQMEIKKADRNAGFVRLYELIDWTALEFYDDGRLIFLGADKPGGEPVVFQYQADAFAQRTQDVWDPMSGELLAQGTAYYPRVDVTVNAGDGIIRSKAATLQALEKLGATPVTADNFRILCAQLEVLDIPQKQDILDEWEKKFAPRVPPEVTAALENDPELLALVAQAVQRSGGQGGGMPQAAPAGMQEGGVPGGMPQMWN